MIEEKKQNFLSKLWNKTIFPDMIRDKKEEKAFQREVRMEAKKKAREEMKDKIVDELAKKEVDKLTGNDKKDKKAFGEKLTKGFEMKGEKKDIGAMMGFGGGGSKDNNAGGSPVNDEKISKLLGIHGNKDSDKKEKKEKDKNDFEDKIKRMLS